jgi:hypothetical protein
MGTIKQGILGGFNGKVGTVVGSSWKGTAYMRGRAQHIKNPRTAGQIYQRNAMKAIALALRPIASTLSITFKNSAQKMSGYNKAVSINYKEAVENVGGVPTVNYSRLILSKGNLKAFRSLFIEDYSGNGNYYVSTMMEVSQLPEFDGLIFFIYDIEDGIWQTGVIKEHYEAGDTLEFSGGMPLHAAKQYLGFACTYDPVTGQVSNPLEYVEVNGG